eukprot:gb/GFBE01068794.1/.p1 GENE.gb/GFBE01068794.1/~~gb/GFBE01068794.1/.p1  ORF type:complete len:396 (+),score=81.36 gb/GFBE01068794.1/:1-1188(+)
MSRLDSAPRSVEDFAVGKTLGTGTFGRVRFVTDRCTEEHFALRWQKKVQLIKLKQVEHIRTECEILLNAQHPLIIKALAAWDSPSDVMLLMEFAAGGELFAVLRRQGRLRAELAQFYAANVVCMLEYLHGNGIVHRDLKPENLLLTEQGYLKLVDFGFAKVVADGKTWTLCGTPEYIAPEIVRNKGHGKAVDWWALGILVFEMLVGYPPFYDDDPSGIYQKILASEVHYPVCVCGRVKSLLQCLLENDEKRRSGLVQTKAANWFADIAWSDLLAQKLKAPFLPTVSSPSDTSNFDDYPCDTEHGSKDSCVEGLEEDPFKDWTPRLQQKEMALRAWQDIAAESLAAVSEELKVQEAQAARWMSFFTESEYPVLLAVSSAAVLMAAVVAFRWLRERT